MDTFKARNNHISSQNLSETCKILWEKYLGTFGESFAWLYEKERKIEIWENIAATHLIIQTMSRQLEERGKTSLQCPSCGQRLGIVGSRYAP